jgi:NAD(P)-dependent dehydrogenase (short-subunit alcohol dehydrogenase family)
VQAFCKSSCWDTPIDAVFNNAGFGLIAPIESASTEAIRQQFEANYFGTMAITQKAMEHFRQHNQGVLMVNIHRWPDGIPILWLLQRNQACA